MRVLEHTNFGGAGVAGTGSTLSSTGLALGGEAGIWGDVGDAPGYCCYGVVGTSDNNVAVAAISTGGADAPALLAKVSTTATAFEATGSGGNCTISGAGDLDCSGTISQAALTTDGRQVKLYGLASPENWFEDFGSGQLSGGSAKIPLDPAFASTVNSGETYHVFLTPRGECEGLYVAATTASGFEVRELHHGTSNISFDYRIIAKRRGYERVRLEDVTERMNAARQRQAEMEAKRTAARISAPAQPTPR